MGDREEQGDRRENVSDPKIDDDTSEALTPFVEFASKTKILTLVLIFALGNALVNLFRTLQEPVGESLLCMLDLGVSAYCLLATFQRRKFGWGLLLVATALSVCGAALITLNLLTTEGMLDSSLAPLILKNVALSQLIPIGSLILLCTKDVRRHFHILKEVPPVPEQTL